MTNANRCNTTSWSSAAARPASPPRSASSSCCAARQRRRVCVIEKGSEVGAHILSGAVMDPRALAELFPDWKAKGAPLNAPVAEDRFLFLTEQAAFKIPNFLLPACFQNHGNYVISLGNVCRWLGQQAEGLGVEIFPGFAAAEVLYDDDGSVKGVATGDMGIGKDGKPTAAYQPGMELHAQVHVLRRRLPRPPRQAAGGEFKLRDGARPAGLRHRPEGAVGDQAREAPGRAGRPHRGLAARQRRPTAARSSITWKTTWSRSASWSAWPTRNPYLSPVRGIPALQDASGHPPFLEGGKRISYGARAITAGGLQSLPKLVVPGRLPDRRRRGLPERLAHQGQPRAIKSGMLAAEAAFEALQAGRSGDELAGLSGGLPSELAVRRAVPRAQFQALDGEGAVHRHG